jgi:hypothetical protein
MNIIPDRPENGGSNDMTDFVLDMSFYYGFRDTAVPVTDLVSESLRLRRVASLCVLKSSRL